MEILIKHLVLVSVISCINGQFPVTFDEVPVKPDRCHAAVDLLTEQCCILPPFFARDIAKKCGGMYKIVANDIAHNITYRTRYLPAGCEPWTCILNEYKLVTDENNFDDEKYYAHLDRWVELNPDFSEIMPKVKASCKEYFEATFPLEVCEFQRFHFCIRRSIELDCPVVKNTDLCLKQKAFYEDCREFYIRK